MSETLAAYHAKDPASLDFSRQDPQRSSLSGRGHWQIHRLVSPLPQRDWAERWPDALEKSEMRRIEDLQHASTPLASVATVRCLNWNPDLPPSSSVGALRGIWVRADYSDHSRTLVARVLKKSTDWKVLHDEARRAHLNHSEERSSTSSGIATAQGFVIALQDETWYAPIAQYIESQIVQCWLDHKAERRGDRWHLTEQIVKFIPIPRLLLKALGFGVEQDSSPQINQPLLPVDFRDTSSFALPLPGDWEKWMLEMPYFPGRIKENLLALPPGELMTKTLKASVFVRASRVIAPLKDSQEKLQPMVTPQGSVRWREFFQVLPRSEFSSVALHSGVRMTGTLPPHVPILKIDKVAYPSPGIVLLTEVGFRLHLGCDDPRLLEMLSSQLDGLKHPTWNELSGYLKLPRTVETVEQTAQEVVRNAVEQASRIQTLREILEICLDF